PDSLPDDPSPEQVDAWVELAELISDEDFKSRCREMAVAGASRDPEADCVPYDHPRLTEVYARMSAENVDPATPRAAAALDEVIDPTMTAAQRRELADQVALFSDRRVERYWTLLGILNGWPPYPPQLPMM